MPVCEKPIHIFEPTPLQCGQAALAMLTGKSVEEIVSVVGTERETTLKQMFYALDYYGIKYKKERPQEFSLSRSISLLIFYCSGH